MNLKLCWFQWAKQGNAVALEKHSKYLDIRDHIGASPLHYASSKGYFRIIRLIAQVIGQQGNRATPSDTYFSLNS